MAATDLTILNPQAIKVTAQVYVPGLGTQAKVLVPHEPWVISNGVKDGQWVGFFDPETQELLTAASLPSQSTIAQILLEVGFEGLLRLNPQEPLTASNGLDQQVIARLQNVGAATFEDKTLAPRGHAGSSHGFPYDARGQYLGFYDTDGTFITATLSGTSFSEVTLIAPKQVFVVGTPYPVTQAAAELKEGAVRVTLPMVGEE